MSSTGVKVARKVVADALKTNWAGIEIRFAARCTVGIAIPLIAAALAGAPLAGASAAFGALVTGLASRQGVYRTRIGVMLVAGATLALSGFAGALTGPIPLLNIALLAVWTMVFGIVGSLGRAATVVSINGCVAFVLFSNPPYDTSNPGVQALAVFAGSALQMLLLVLIWPLSRFGAERAALCASYSALSQYATGLRADDLGLPDTTSVAAVSAALADPQPFGGRGEIAAYQALADEAERLRGTLAALATEQHLLGELGVTAIAEAIRETGHAAGQLLDDIATAISKSRPPSHQLTDVRALDDALLALTKLAPPGAAYVDDAHALAGQLRGALRSAAAAANGGLSVEADAQVAYFAPISLKPIRRLFERFLANCSWSSIYARHAVRLTVTLTLAVILQHLLPLQHAQWLCLAVIFVLRPDFSSTFTRGVGRVAGTIAGAVLASLIAAFHPSDQAYIVLAIVFAACAFALFNVSYALFSTAITGYVVYMLAFGGSPEHTSAFDRVIATLIGGTLALIAYGLWPAWSHAHVGDDLAALVDAQRTYVRLVLQAFSEPVLDDAAVRAAQVAAWRARSNAEAAVDLMAGEPVKPQGVSLRTALGVLAATRRFGIAGLTLRARHTRIPGDPQHPVLDQFITDLDITLRAIVASLRTGEPPAALPPLRNDQIALQRNLDQQRDPAVEILGSETDLIVDSVNSITAILMRAR
jgi:uncharacterized membrane protein YccC